jgi:hypothetical protein
VGPADHRHRRAPHRRRLDRHRRQPRTGRLKQRPEGTIRAIPIPPGLVRLLDGHLGASGTPAGGRLFRGARGGLLSESTDGRAWHTARADALGPGAAAAQIVRRP